jgi:hypothetical protein
MQMLDNRAADHAIIQTPRSLLLDIARIWPLPFASVGMPPQVRQIGVGHVEEAACVCGRCQCIELLFCQEPALSPASAAVAHLSIAATVSSFVGFTQQHLLERAEKIAWA